MSTSAQGLCPICNDCFAPEDEATKCRACRATYHLECAGVTEVDSKFGCGFCYHIPGNLPRRRIRTAGADDGANDEDGPTEDNTHTQGAAPRDDGRSSRASSGSSRRSDRQDRMMAMLQTQTELLTQQMKVLGQLVPPQRDDKAQSAQAVRMERVGEWIGDAGGTNVNRGQVPEQRRWTDAPPPNGAATSGQDRRRQRETIGSARFHSTGREDLALNVTKITTTEEFLECLQEAKQGVPGAHHTPSFTKQPPALPRFEGGDLEWLEFIAYYLESTQEYRVSDLKNVERLRAALVGEPLKILNSTMIYTSSLADAMDQLRITYGDPVRIIAALEREVLLSEMVSDNGQNLQRLLIKTKRFVNYVEACGYSDQLTSRSLLSKLQSKLPFFMSMRWGDRLRDRRVMPSLKSFSAYLQDEFETALQVGQNQVRMVTEKKPPPKRVLMTTVEVPVTAVSEVKKEPVPPNNVQKNNSSQSCPMCNGPHRLKVCSRFEQATDDDRWKVVDAHKLCWNCLRPHQRRQCRVPDQCGVNGCKYRHDSLLHNILARRFPAAETSLCVAGAEEEGVLFKIMPIQLHSEEEAVESFCFMDEGSSVSIIDAGLADVLGLTGPVESLTIKWTNGRTQTDRNSRRVTLQISGEDGVKYEIGNVRTMKNLELPQQTLCRNEVNKIFPDDGGPVPFVAAMPRLLLGLRHAHLGAPREVREDPSTGLLALKTKLGWLIYGSGGTSGLDLRVCHVSSRRGTEMESELEALVKAFYDLDSFGVRAAPLRLGKDQERALVILEQTTRNVGRRYETGLLWRDDAPRLPRSREMCLKRAKSLRQRMENDPELADKLQRLIDDYLRKGYCSDVGGLPPNGPCWYLPVFPVVNPNKPGKVRLVFDAAAKTSDGRSLNTFLLSGPDMLTPLPDVLMRFREKKIAVSADVAEMFHQVRVREQDQDAQRFFWWPIGTEEPRELRLEVMTFGATCSPAAAQFVQKKNARLFEEKYADAVKEILNSYYVDDQLSSFHSAAEATRVMCEVVKIQENAGFELKKIRSSNHSVLVALSGPQPTTKDLPGAGGSVLGMEWDCERDHLQFRVDNALRLRDHDPLTRRKMLSGTMSLFDPLGLAANVVVKAKMLMKLCLRLEWDEQVPDELKQQWQDWCDCLLRLKEVAVPRFLGLHPTSPWELHTFVDASEEAYAAAAYVRGFSSSGEVVCTLVMAKTRVAPARATTMPRMELLAAVLGARLADSVMKATTMPITRQVFWSDSMDCLCWVRSSHRRYHAFVAARVNEILDLTQEESWRWVPTKMNVADDATRFASPIDDERWLRGPEFLYHDEKEWPITPHHLGTPKEEVMSSLSVKVVNLGLIPDAARFSRWRRLVNATAYAFRLFQGERGRRGGLELEPEELQRAEEELWRAAQREEYADLVKKLRADSKHNTAKGHPLHRLCPVVDEKCLLRVNGRLPASVYPVEVRQPIILPATSRITQLYVTFIHQQFLHMNHETVVNEIRRHYCIPGLRRLVKKVAQECHHCRVRRPRIEFPQEGPLPPARTAIGFKAFTYCGLDYFGPFEVVVGRRREKRWGALFTCMTTRAVHMEIAHSLNLESCAMCVRMMCARRDVVPHEIRSDRGTNFVATDKELQRFADRFPAIKWCFNPPAAPHMGGAWERMVRAIKRCLYEVIGDRALSDEVLRCALIESEWVVNQHPLTHVPVDSDSEPALTPNDFLNGARQQRDRQEVIMGPDEGLFLKKSWRLAQQIADHFWRRFDREMVPILNLPTKWFKRGEPLAVDDPVMVADDSRRGAWRRGRVTEIIKGKRGDQVRQVRVATPNGVLTRPAVKVAKIDVVRAR